MGVRRQISHGHQCPLHSGHSSPIPRALASSKRTNKYKDVTTYEVITPSATAPFGGAANRA